MKLLDGSVVSEKLGKEARDFLRWAGVKEFDWGKAVLLLAEKEYGGEKQPTRKTNKIHVRIIKELYDQGKLAEETLRNLGHSFKIIRDKNG